MNKIKSAIISLIFVCASIGALFVFFGWGIMTAARDYVENGRFVELALLIAIVGGPVVLFLIIKSIVKKIKNR